jgi:hypothetical protein
VSSYKAAMRLRLAALERVAAHHERRGTAEQTSDLDRLGDLGFRGARGASVASELPDTVWVCGDRVGDDGHQELVHNGTGSMQLPLARTNLPTRPTISAYRFW